MRNWLIGKFNEIGNVTIKSTGANVEFNKTGAQRAIKNARQKKNNIAYPEIEKVVSGAKYSGFREADERHQNVKGQDVYHSGVVYKGVPYSVEFYVDVPLSGNTGDNFAGNKIREIKIAPTETRVTSENQNRPANNLSDAISNISLAVLRGKVKPARYDMATETLYQLPQAAYGADSKADTNTPEFKRWSGNSPIVSVQKAKNYSFETGKAVTVEAFHGTKTKGIEVFEYDKNRQTGTDYGEAYYATTDYDKASGYAYDQLKDKRIIDIDNRRNVLKKEITEIMLKEGKNEKTDQLMAEFSELSDRKYNIVQAGTVEDSDGAIMPIYMNFRNPLVVDADNKFYFQVYNEYFQKARSKGHDGIIVKNVIDNPRGEQRAIDVFIVFSPNQIKSVYNRGSFSRTNDNTVYQTGEPGEGELNLETEAVQGQGEDRINSIPKGAYSPQMNVIYLFENADASTFMHESSHFFKKQLKYFAGKSEKSAQLLKAVEDWENSEFDRQFVIDEKDGDFRVLDKNGIIIHEGFKSADLARNYAKEELFARGFEQFLREGKAPSNYLKRVFDMFLNWLRRIYTTAKEMRVKINKDISAVYGDILGGEDLDYYLQAPIDEVVNYNREKAIEERRKMDEVYKAANRDYIAGKSKFQKTVQQILKDAKDFTQDAIVPLEEVVKSISPELWTKNRRLEIAKLQKNSQYAKRVKGFFDKAQKLMPEVFNKLDLALKNRDVETVAGILSENDMTNDFIEVRKVLDELREQMIEVGVEINYLPDYFPRKLRDADGLLDYLRQKYEGKPEYSKIMQVLEEKSKDGRIRSEEDRAQIVNSLFRGYGGTISLANVGNAKERSIDLIDAEMNKYYKNSVDALVDYVSGAINLTENKKYFGKEAEDVQILRRRVSNRKTTIAEYEKMDAKEAKWKEIKTRNYKIGAVDAQIRNTYDDLLRQDLEERKARLETEVEFLKNRKAEQVKEIALRRMNEELKTLEDELSEKADNTIEESVGNLLYDLAKDGVITHTQEMRLKELLVARFSNKGLGNVFLRMLRDGGYIWTLGNVGSAITQFGDLGSAVYKAGFWNTMFENVKAWQGKSEIMLEDLGLNKVITDGGYVDTSKLTKHLDKVLKYTGFEKIDGISKMTLVNAAVNKARRDAQAGSKELEEYLRVEFGNRWKEVANDLKEGRKTPEIIEYAMFQLMDVQPVTIDQMPKFYAEGGKKRMFYMMKSYFIKQLNEYRKICFETANPSSALAPQPRP